MLRRIFSIVLITALSFFGGITSLVYTLNHFSFLQTLTLQTWQAFPEFGTNQADPYARAQAVRDDVVVLGKGEGIIFQCTKDDSGRPLEGGHHYRLVGLPPAAKFFSLYTAQPNHKNFKFSKDVPSFLTSYTIAATDPHGHFTVDIAPFAQPYNWLASPQKGRYILLFTLYDSSISGATILQRFDFPHIYCVD